MRKFKKMKFQTKFSSKTGNNLQYLGQIKAQRDDFYTVLKNFKIKWQ